MQSQISCPDSSGSFYVQPGGVGNGYISDCSNQDAYVTISLRGVVPDNLHINECGGHAATYVLQVWAARVCSGDNGSQCSSCSNPIDVWRWDDVNGVWYGVNGINDQGNGTVSSQIHLPPPTGACTGCCIQIFIGIKNGSAFCGQDSNPCFNTGTVSYYRTCGP